jgi:hypothetical protein
VEQWGGWFLFALFAAILVWEEVWDLPDTAALSSWLLLLITGGAVVCSAFFERRLWCRCVRVRECVCVCVRVCVRVRVRVCGSGSLDAPHSLTGGWQFQVLAVECWPRHHHTPPLLRVAHTHTHTYTQTHARTHALPGTCAPSAA